MKNALGNPATHVIQGTITKKNQPMLRDLGFKSLGNIYWSDTKTLDLSKTEISDEHIPLICAFIKTNGLIVKYVVLCSKKISSASVKEISKLPTITALNLENNTIDNETADCLATNPNISQLVLRGCTFTEEGLVALAMNTTIKKLDLSGIAMTDKVVRCLTTNPNISQLVLRGCTFTEEGLVALAMNTTIKKLDLSGIAMTDKVVRCLTTNPNISQLVLRGCTFTEEGLVALAMSTTIKKLDLSGIAMTDTVVKLLVSSKSLTNLRLNDCGINTNHVSLLVKNTSIKVLELSRNDLDGTAQEMLFSSQTIEKLTLEDTKIDFKLLRQNRSLLFFNVGNIPEASALEVRMRINRNRWRFFSEKAIYFILGWHQEIPVIRILPSEVIYTILEYVAGDIGIIQSYKDAARFKAVCTYAFNFCANRKSQLQDSDKQKPVSVVTPMDEESNDKNNNGGYGKRKGEEDREPSDNPEKINKTDPSSTTTKKM